MGLSFALKGGTSLSKGFGIIDRFSEDIDIRIEPPSELEVNTNPKAKKPNQIAGRKNYYDCLSENISIDGVHTVERDHVFDDGQYRSGGIRLCYTIQTTALAGIKDGVLLEVGFDDVMLNSEQTWTVFIMEKRLKLNTF